MNVRNIVVGHRSNRELAFVGPFGVGKSTAVRALSTVEVATTEVLTAAALRTGRRAAEQKSTTTVALDYGEWRGPFGTVTLYGTPGQSRFRTDRDRHMPSWTVIVLLLFGQNDYALDEAEEWLRYLDAAALGSRLTVVVTRQEEETAHPLDEYEQLAGRFSPDIEVTTADPRDGEDVARVVRLALRRSPGAKRQDRAQEQQTPGAQEPRAETTEEQA